MVSKRNETAVTAIGDRNAALLAALPQGDAKDQSLVALKEYRIVPRLQVLQGLSPQELKDRHGEGSVILMPGDTLVSKRATPFLFVPIFFFAEYITWRDRRDKSAQPIEARSFKKDGAIAALSRDPKKRSEQYPGGPSEKPWERRHTEHLCFTGLIYGEHPLAGTLCVLQFQRGEFTTGRSFTNSIGMRRIEGRQVSLWMQVWEFSVLPRSKNGNNWWGIQPAAPTNADPYIQAEEIVPMRALRYELAQAFEENRLIVDQETGGADDSEAAAETAFDTGEM